MEVVEFLDEVKLLIGAVVFADVAKSKILIAAPVREILVEELGVFFEQFVEVGVFVGRKAIHEGNTKVKKGVGIDIVEIVLVFHGGVEITDFFHGGVGLGDNFRLYSINDRIFADHVAIKTIWDEGDFMGINEKKLLKHHVVKDGWNILEFSHFFEKFSLENFVPGGAVNFEKETGIFLDDDIFMLGLNHFARIKLAGVEIDTIEATDGDVGVIFGGGSVELFGEIFGDVIVAIDKADVFAVGFLDTIFATTPDAFVFLVDNNDFVAVFFVVIFEDLETVVG